MKKPLSRSQRGSKGIKGKHVLQICVLLGVCIWLIYQLKYSHDKKKEFYEKDGKKSSDSLLSDSKTGLVKLGRKDLLPGYHNQNEDEKHVEEDEDEEEEIKNNGNGEDEKEVVVEEDEEDKNKQEDEVVEEDEEENRHEEAEIDEQDQSKTGGDTDKDDEFLEEEKKSGSNDRAEDVDMTVDEARDEHYKADDASSAVSHDSWVLNTDKLKESSGNSNETGQEKHSNASMSEVEIQKEPILKFGETENGDFVNKTTTQSKDGDSESSSSVIKTVVTESQGETVHGNSTVAVLEGSGFLQNETEIMQNRGQEDGALPSGISDLHTILEIDQTRNATNPSITVSASITNKVSIQDESRNSTSESSLIENISGSNTTEVKEESLSEGDDGSGDKDNANLFTTDEADDTSENSISQDEMEAFTDPETLPDIRVEGNEDDEEEAIAAE